MYDCTVSAPRRVFEREGTVSLNAIQFPDLADESWRFRVSLTHEDDGISADVRWRTNPIQIAGRHATLPTSEGSHAFLAAARGPCLFTEGPCMSLVHIVDHSANSASISITPAALAQGQQGRVLWNVIIAGTCTRSGTER